MNQPEQPAGERTGFTWAEVDCPCSQHRNLLGPDPQERGGATGEDKPTVSRLKFRIRQLQVLLDGKRQENSEWFDGIIVLRAQLAERDARIRELTEERAQLAKDVAAQDRTIGDFQNYLRSANRQLAVVDENIPPWEGTGRGRIETIQLMRAQVEAITAERDRLRQELDHAG